MDSVGRDFISLEDQTAAGLQALLDGAEAFKRQRGGAAGSRALQGKVIGLIFEKPSLRTRLGFEVAVYRLGGQVSFMGPESVALGQREALKDFAQVTARFLDALVLRVVRHATILEIARYAGKPVINGLSDLEHPCQALADLLTIREKVGGLQGVQVAYIGDANNVCRSLARGLLKCGGHLKVASPAGYQLPPEFIAGLGAGGSLVQLEDPREAVQGAQVIYTDVWTSMGQEREAEARAKVFQRYQLNAQLTALAPKAWIMHCLPAHRGMEITDEVIDSACSVVYDQAENRLHTQQALLFRLLGGSS